MIKLNKDLKNWEIALKQNEKLDEFLILWGWFIIVDGTTLEIKLTKDLNNNEH